MIQINFFLAVHPCGVVDRNDVIVHADKEDLPTPNVSRGTSVGSSQHDRGEHNGHFGDEVFYLLLDFFLL